MTRILAITLAIAGLSSKKCRRQFQYIVLGRLWVRLGFVVALGSLAACGVQESETEKRARLERGLGDVTIEEPVVLAEAPALGKSQAWEAIHGVMIDGSGYASQTAPYKDYSAQPFARVRPDGPVKIELAPHYPTEHLWTEHWRVWIDMDGDRRFSEDELVLSTVGVGKVEQKLYWTESQADQLFGDRPRTRMMRVAMAWQVAPGPNDRFDYGQVNDYGLIFERRRDRARPIRLLSGTIRPWEMQVPLRVELGLHHLIQFKNIPTSEEKQVLEARGIPLLDYVPEGSFWARINSSQEALANLKVAGGVVFAMPGEARLKVSPRVTAGSFAPDIRQKAGDTVEFLVKWFADASEQERASALAAIGDVELKRERSRMTSVIVMHPAQVPELAQWDAVQWIEPAPGRPTVDSLDGNNEHNVTPLFNPPYDLDGTGIKAAVFDACFADENHVEFGGRLSYDINFGNVAWCNTTGGYVRSHPTHMAGLIGASGVGDSNAIGAARAATLISYAFHLYYSAEEFEDQIISEGITVSSHSYSDPVGSVSDFGEYFADARDADQWAGEYGLLSVWSAGNYGRYRANDVLDWNNLNWNTMHNGGIGKNSIAVGAGETTSYAGYAYSLRTDSSKGPTQDGRVKPDLVAKGSGSIVTPEAGGGYGSSNSTSAAAPQVAGIVALLAQEYKNVHGDAETMPPALAKALLIQSAEDMSDNNTFYWCSDGSGNEWCDGIELTHSNSGPDYATGWGWANAKGAVDLLRESGKYVKGTIAQGEEKRYSLSLPATSPFKGTLLWADPEATEGAALALVNDLDFELHAAGSPVAYPYVLDPGNPDQPAIAGINSLDNVEQIKVDPLDPGTYELVIRGTTVPVGPQDFYLVVSEEFDAIIIYATLSSYDGNLSGRAGADQKCLTEKPLACANRDRVRAIITVHTDDEVRDMQSLYDIPDTIVEGSAGLKLANRWSQMIGAPLPHTLQDATNLSSVYWWSGSHWDGKTYSYVTPGSDYYCSQFTSSTSDYRAPYGSGTTTNVGAQYELGWLGGNQYPHCSWSLPLMCVCY